ncbi:MAG: cation transporter [Spirochaetales bacterium]|nr:cation transporter [Spirochaetales bacterium]
MDRERSERIALISWIAIVGNLVLALIKIIAGLSAGSLAVVGDGIDSTTDIIASGITLFAARVIAKPPDREHPYGHFRAETIATKTLSFLIFFVGAQLALSTVRRLIGGEHGEVPQVMALYAAGISIIGKIALSVLLLRSAKKLASTMLRANGKNMQSDILISGGVLLGVLLTRLLHFGLLDSVIALLISLWIMKTAFSIFMESNLELMDGIGDQTVYPAIFKAVEEVSGAVNPHRTRVRRLGNMYIIDLDIEVDGGKTVIQAHRIAVQVEQMIKRRVDNVYDIMVHVEPRGNVELNERFGITDPEGE